MPWHMAPVLFQREYALEQNGLIQTQNTAGVTALEAAQQAGTAITQVPVGYTWIIRGTTYVATAYYGT